MKLLLRFDDYSELSNSSLDMRIIETMLSADCKVLVGVVPAVAALDWEVGSDIPLRRLSRERANILKELLPHGVEIAMHGYTHQTVTRWSGLAEFGDAVSLQRQTERLLDGKKLLEDLFGSEIAWFIPPWNSYSSTTLQALRTVGFSGISADAYFGPLEEGLKFAPYSCLPRELTLACKRAQSNTDSVVIVMLHDYDFKESDLGVDVFDLAEFRQKLKTLQQDGVSSCTFSELIHDEAFGPSRASINQQLRKIANSPVRYLMKPGITCVYWGNSVAEKLSNRMEYFEKIAKIPFRLYRRFRQ